MDTKNTNDPEFVISDMARTLLQADPTGKGLSVAEASARIARYGYNEIAQKKRNQLLELLGRFWGPMPWLLESAMVLSFFLGHIVEAAMIFVLVSVNAVIGYRHETNSRKAVDLLKKRLATTVRVLRDGQWVSLPARELFQEMSFRSNWAKWYRPMPSFLKAPCPSINPRSPVNRCPLNSTPEVRPIRAPR